ncbi:MAG: hypothetical protein JNJ51_09305 [Methylobacillus glycogenes]|nr:hypothetical protein [Methylobacillus glycogenes]
MLHMQQQYFAVVATATMLAAIEAPCLGLNINLKGSQRMQHRGCMKIALMITRGGTAFAD